MNYSSIAETAGCQLLSWSISGVFIDRGRDGSENSFWEWSDGLGQFDGLDRVKRTGLDINSVEGFDDRWGDILVVFLTGISFKGASDFLTFDLFFDGAFVSVEVVGLVKIDDVV